jgi:ATP-binding cassette subfamily B protein
MIAIREGSVVLEHWFIALLIENVTLFSAGNISKPAFLDALIWIGLAFGIAVIITAAARWTQNRLISKLELEMITDLKRTLFSHIIRLPHRFHTSHKSGSLIARLGRGASAIERMMDNIIFNFAPLIIQAGLSIAVLIALDGAFAITLFVLMTVFIGYGWLLNLKQRPLREAANDLEDIEKATVADTFTNVETVKYFGKERLGVAKYLGKVRATADMKRREWNVYGQIDAGHILILGIGVAALLALSIRGVLARTSGVAELTFVYTAYLGLLGPMNGFVRGLRDNSRACTDFESLIRYLDEHNDVYDVSNAQPITITNGSITFEKVTFTYRKRVVIDSLTLSIHPGEKVALVGSSGAGKSTLVKLLYRFYDPQEGTIRVDNNNIKSAPQEQYRAQLAIVPQEGVLFDDTLYNNIAFSNPGASERDVMEAIKLAQLLPIVKRLPEGVHTIVGERGIKLSGGERQRVAIARAILANTRILVLDEATSSLDSETEHAIQRGLKALLKGRTAIIIAHRLSTIMHADRIIVLENGKIVQQGTHKELLKKPGRYKTLWKLQKGGYIGE